MKIKFEFPIVWVLYTLLAFPLFYFVYKFGNPMFGCNDFFSYYILYDTFDISKVEAPFNMRLLSTFFVYLLNKTGLSYETATNFDQFTNLSKQVYFNSVLFNYLSVIATCTVIYYTIKKFFANNVLLSFVAGIFYLLGFGTIFYEIMPITDAFSVFLFSAVLFAYLSKSYTIIPLLLPLIFQREYIFMALGLIALVDYFKYRERYYVLVLITCVFCFAIYYTLRKTVFFTPRFDHQASPSFFLDSIQTLKFPLGPYIKQTLMTLNLFIFYVLVLIYKNYYKLNIDKFSFFKLLLLFVQINLISVAAVFGNNTGRYFYILVPLVIFELVKEIQPLLIKHK